MAAAEKFGSSSDSPNLLLCYRSFRRYAGSRLPLLILIISIGGLVEGLGVGVFIPLLSLGNVSPEESDAVSKLVADAFSYAGIELTFNSLLAVILFCFLFKGAISLCQTVVTARIMATVVSDLRESLVTRLSATSLLNFGRLKLGFLTNVVATETERTAAAFNFYTMTIVSVFYAVIYIALALVIDVRGAVLVTTMGVLAVASLRVLHKLTRDYSHRVSRRNARLHDLLIQGLQGFKYLRATDGFSKLNSKLFDELEVLAHCVYRQGIFGGFVKTVSEPLGAVVLVAALFLNVSVMGRPLAGMLVLALVLYRLMGKLMSVQTNWQKFNGAIGGMVAVEAALESLGAETERSGEQHVSEFSSRLSLDSVSLKIGDHEILDDVTVEIGKNTMVAIVGRTGAGKSTIVNLLTGVLEPTGGRVMIDGVDYTKLDKRSLRRLFGYVPQDPVMFADTIANNVSLWTCDVRVSACAERVQEALRAAHAEGFVSATEDGCNTFVGSGGRTISGGQSQLLCLARELFKDPEVLILDEPMSALDAESEWILRRTLQTLKRRRTILVVTHRLATVRDCDYVYVVNHGRVEEEGTYEELTQKDNSILAELVRLQGA